MQIICLLFIFSLGYIKTENDLGGCKEINTYGYKYDALFKIHSQSINFYVKAVSDAHILLVSNPNVLDQERVGVRSAQILEVVIGGGRNSFSEVRIGMMGGRKTSRVHVQTPEILSTDEFRGFWINLTASDSDSLSSVAVGLIDNSTAFMTATASGAKDDLTYRASYFGISTWNGIKGKWRMGCPKNKLTGLDEVEEQNITGVLKLKRDLVSFYEGSVPPVSDKGILVIEVGMNVHRFRVKDTTSEMTLNGRIYLKWNDPRLQWDPTKYDGITSFLLGHDYFIWQPYFGFYGMTNGVVVVDYSAAIFLSQDGNVSWSPYFSFETLCDMPIYNWPNDNHNCFADLIFKNIYEAESVTMNMLPPSHWQINITDSEWYLAMIPHIGSYEDNKNDEYLSLEIQFKRKNVNYKLLFATPFICVGIMVLASLLLPPNHPGKLYLASLCILLLTIRMLTIIQIIPSNCIKVPPLVNIYLMGLILSCFSILMNVLVKNMSCFQWTLPYWCKQILTNPIFETIICYDGAAIDPTIYKNLQGSGTTEAFDAPQEWVLICVTLERLFFVIYLIVYSATSLTFYLN